jgi:hypothetical protein
MLKLTSHLEQLVNKKFFSLSKPVLSQVNLTLPTPTNSIFGQGIFLSSPSST